MEITVSIQSSHRQGDEKPGESRGGKKIIPGWKLTHNGEQVQGKFSRVQDLKYSSKPPCTRIRGGKTLGLEENKFWKDLR